MSVSMNRPEGSVAPVESATSRDFLGSHYRRSCRSYGITLILLLLGSGVGLDHGVALVSSERVSRLDRHYCSNLAAGRAVVVVGVRRLPHGPASARNGPPSIPMRSSFATRLMAYASWALATIFVAGFLASSLTSLAGADARRHHRRYNARVSPERRLPLPGAPAADLSTSYFTDVLLRPEQNRTRATRRRKCFGCRDFTHIAQWRGARRGF